MKEGDLVRHKITGFTAVVMRPARSTSDAGMMTVLTTEGRGRWKMSSCEVLWDDGETRGQNTCELELLNEAR